MLKLIDLLNCIVDTQTVKVWGFDDITDEEVILDVYDGRNSISSDYNDDTVEYVWVDSEGALNITIAVGI